MAHGLLRREEALGNPPFVDRIQIAAAAPYDEKKRQRYDEHGKEAPPRRRQGGWGRNHGSAEATIRRKPSVGGIRNV